MKQNKFNEIASDVKVCLGQIKIVSGDLLGNTKKITNAIEKAIESEVDILVFPELAITGYNCGMLFLQQHFIDYNLRFLHKVIAPKVPKTLVVVVGFVDCIGKKFDGTPNIQNSLAVIQDGYVVGKYAKILLANGGHHDDSHYFTPGTNANVTRVKIKGKEISLGTVICEDAWQQDHDRNIVRESVQNGAEVVVAINQSYFYYNKQYVRRNMCMKHSQSNGIYFINVNNVGVGDSTKNFILYDGGSIITDPIGQIVAEANHFEEELKITPLKFSYERKQESPKIRISEHPIFHPGGYSKYEEIFKALVFAQREIFKDLNFSKAIVAVSGGLDSSVCLPIVVQAMGAENVYAISMPSKYNSDLTKSNAQKLCDNLGVKLFWLPIKEVQESYINSFTKTFETEPSLINISTFDAVGRTVAGIAASQHLKAGLVSTSNHTELVLNWFSWHDISTAAVYAPLGDISKVEVFKLAEYINKKFDKEIIPKNLFDGTTEPGPELADAAHAKWNYFVVSGICSTLIRERKDVSEIVSAYENKTLSKDFFPPDQFGNTIYDLVKSTEEFYGWAEMCFERQKQSVYKNSCSASPLIISPFSRGFSNRETIINHYKGHYFV